MKPSDRPPDGVSTTAASAASTVQETPETSAGSAGTGAVAAAPAVQELPISAKQVVVLQPDGSTSLGFDPEAVAALDAALALPTAVSGASPPPDVLAAAVDRSAIPDLNRLLRLREWLILLDELQVAQAEATAFELHELPIERVRKRTTSLIIVDLFYLILQLTIINPSQTGVSIGGQTGSIVALIAAVLLAIFGLVCIHKRQGLVFSIFVLLEAVAMIFTLKVLSLLWVFLLFRVTMLISAVQLRLLWARQDRAKAALEAAREAMAAQLAATLSHVDALVVLARSAQWDSVARSLLVPGASGGSDSSGEAARGSDRGGHTLVSVAGGSRSFRIGERGTFVMRQASPGDHARFASLRNNSQRAVPGAGARVLPHQVAVAGSGSGSGSSASSPRRAGSVRRSRSSFPSAATAERPRLSEVSEASAV